MLPDRKGQILWQSRIGEGGAVGGIEWGPATDGRGNNGILRA